MNIAEFSIKKRTISLVLTFALIVGGVMAYGKMGRLEDPAFTIKSAQVITTYPGALPEEVEEEVTDELESAIQQMGQLKRIESVSLQGMSIITVVIKDKYNATLLPQVWDELRRKVGDARSSLPPGTGEPLVVDDFGDVYGIFLGVTADGYSYRELKDYTDFLRKELLLVPNVAKVTTWGEQQEAIYVEIAHAKLPGLGVSLSTIHSALQKNNLVVDSGHVQAGTEYLRIQPTGEISSVEQLGEIYINAPGASQLVYLKDIATIRRDYVEPSGRIMRQDGQKAIAVGISLVEGGNIVTLGEAIDKRLAELDSVTPVGINLKKIYFQPDYVTTAVENFIISLLEAIAIVIGVLLIFMGARSGLLIGAILLITVCGSFIFMEMMGIELQRISLGALIIALGMLVDNAIVITEGMLIRIEQGENRIQAAKNVVNQNIWPLLGATAIAVMAFSAIGLSEDNTGEYCGSLFWVLFISLGLSWITAITITPLFCTMYLKGTKTDIKKDPYSGILFRSYRSFLRKCLRFRWLTVGSMTLLLGAALIVFGKLEQSFFPPSTQPQFFLDFWKPEGTDIRATSEELEAIENILIKDERVDFISTFVGSGALRFMLVYSPEKKFPNYGQLIITVRDYRDIDTMMEEYRNILQEQFPDAFFKFKKVRLGPGRDDPIQARFSGPDPAVLRQLSTQAQDIIRANPNARGIRDNWRQKVKHVVPVVEEAAARRAGIMRPEIALAFRRSSSGVPVGIYREGDTRIPIISRPPKDELGDVQRLTNISVWSPVTKAMMPIEHMVSSFETRMSDNVRQRRFRKPTITVSCEPVSGQPNTLFKELRPKLEQMPLPEGYTFEWGGEYEDSQNAQGGLFVSIPPTVAIMILITILLFNALRQPLIIWLTVPLALIGVAFGLMITGQPFGFMALLGFLSLTGMLIKNAIVLLDEIDTQIRGGKERYQAVLDSSVSRMRPVLMAASTTVLGMLPLLGDAFFIAMAVTIMAGLTFASILTLVVVPVLYSIFFGIKQPVS